MTNLTEAQLEALITTDISHCQTCQESIVCAISELRELRAERENFDSALEQQMRRGDEYFAQAALKSVTQERLL